MSHRVTQEWMGEMVDTLEDMLRPGLRAVCIGINPALSSVEAGHYYQGRLGQQFYERLSRAGVLERGPGWEDDLAFENGIGFTDIIKRPTRSAGELRRDEFEHGCELLQAKIEAASPQFVIFVFKKTAEAVFGPFSGNGLITGRQFGGGPVFVMPGPFAPAAEVKIRLLELGQLMV